MLSICQRGGLANRLLTVLSHVSVERSAGRPVVVFWPDSRDFPGEWDECFTPIVGLLPLPMHPPLEYADIKEFSIAQDCDWKILQELKPSRPVRDSLPDGDYDAVHIRRTDLSDMAARLGWHPPISDDEYSAFIEQSDREFVWLATDNAETQARMKARHGSKVRALADMHEPHGFRQTDGQWTAIDMFACVKAQKFMGSRHSTLTNLIHMLRDSATF